MIFLSRAFAPAPFFALRRMCSATAAPGHRSFAVLHLARPTVRQSVPPPPPWPYVFRRSFPVDRSFSSQIPSSNRLGPSEHYPPHRRSPHATSIRWQEACSPQSGTPVCYSLPSVRWRPAPLLEWRQQATCSNSNAELTADTSLLPGRASAKTALSW